MSEYSDLQEKWALRDDLKRAHKEIEHLQKKNAELIADAMSLKNRLHKGTKRIDDGILNAMNNSLVPINLTLINAMNKTDLAVSILAREQYLYSRIAEWELSMKRNDREIFRTQHKEIRELRTYLTDENKAFKELKQAEKTIKELRTALNLEKKNKKEIIKALGEQKGDADEF